MIWKILLTLVALCAGAVLVIWLGAVASLDYDRAYSATVADLPLFSTAESAGSEVRLTRIAIGGMEFRARVAGFGGQRGNVILLHGFPETSAMWSPLITLLAGAGYQVVAFDQRGYSPGARPESVADYTMDKLTGDVFDIADAVDFDDFHLIGHDWGSGVGWTMVLEESPRVTTWTSLSIPHIMAYGEAIASDPDQQDRSSYILFFVTPWIPETIFTFNDLNLLRTVIYPEHAPEIADEYLALFKEPGALTAALNWYRAATGGPAIADVDPMVEIPVLFIWGNEDPVIGATALEVQRDYFSSTFTEIELDAGHWLMESQAGTIGPAVLRHLSEHPG